jgi:hypothetical protein
MKQSHPQLAKILQNTLSNPSFLIASVRGPGSKTYKELAERGELENQNFERRLLLWSYCLVGLLTAVHVSEEMSPDEAEVAFGIGLSVWGLSEARVKKLMSIPLVFNPVA